MNELLKLALYVASVWVSNKYAGGYWVVGPVFGLVVLACDWKSTKKNIPAAMAYLGASTLIYALVYRISGLKWGADSELFEYFIGPFPTAVVVGSILLPFAHHLFLKRNGAVAVREPLLLIAGFYLITLVSRFCDSAGVGHDIPWMLILIAVWQGTYLWSYCRKGA